MAEEQESQGVEVDTFKHIIACGDSNDNEIDCLAEALEEAAELIPADKKAAFEVKLRQILVRYGYDPDRDPDDDEGE